MRVDSDSPIRNRPAPRQTLEDQQFSARQVVLFGTFNMGQIAVILLSLNLFFEVHLQFIFIFLTLSHLLGLYGACVGDDKFTLHLCVTIVDHLTTAIYSFLYILFTNQVIGSQFIAITILYTTAQTLIVFYDMVMFCLDQSYFRTFLTVHLIKWCTQTMVLYTNLLFIALQRSPINDHEHRVLPFFCVYEILTCLVICLEIGQFYRYCLLTQRRGRSQSNQYIAKFVIILSELHFPLVAILIVAGFKQVSGVFLALFIYVMIAFPVFFFIHYVLSKEILILFKESRTNHLATVVGEDNQGTMVRKETGLKIMDMEGKYDIRLQRINAFQFKYVQVKDTSPQRLNKRNSSLLHELQMAETPQSNNPGNNHHQITIAGSMLVPMGPVDKDVNLKSSEKTKLKIPDKEKCIACMENEIDTVFHPCLHGCLCYDCGVQIISSLSNCSICRKPLKSLAKFKQDEALADGYYQILTFSVKEDNNSRVEPQLVV